MPRHWAPPQPWRRSAKCPAQSPSFCDLHGASVPAELLCPLFGMTPAEARVASQVLEGGSADAMATRLGVSVNTIKTQLKAVFVKTNTNRQVDLLKLLLALKG